MLIKHLTSSPHFYTYLEIIVGLFLAFNIFEILFLLAHKRRVERNEVRKVELKHRVTTALLTLTDPAEVLPRPRDYTEHEAYIESAASIIESLEGEMAEKARQLIRIMGVDVYFQRRCRDQVWYKRAHAVDILAALRLEKNRDFFVQLFADESSGEVRYRILYGLSLIATDREYTYSIARLLSVIPYTTAKYTEDIFSNIIATLKAAGREEEYKAFLQRIVSDRNILTRVKRDSISACHTASCEGGAEVILDFYAAFPAEPEILIACIKTLVRMGEFSILPGALRNPDWRVRLTALKYAHLSSAPDFPDLKKMLQDNNYHIRINSALALFRTGEEGRAILQAAAASADKFAAAAARHALGTNSNIPGCGAAA
jgi:hypothetical protein